MAHSLFAHLALQFGHQPENLATEALGFILTSSKPAREAMLDVARFAGDAAPSDLHFSTQVSGEDAARPDLVGRDEHGREPLLVEVKFWAGLTENQPVTYLRRLPAGGTLLFVAPADRLRQLWPELRRRCEDAKLAFVETSSTAPTFVATVGERAILLVSWRGLLESIRRRVDAAGDRRTGEDVDQLDGLCERMDSEAFLPLRAEELSAVHYKRILQFNALVDEATNALVNKQVASTKNLRPAAVSGVYGRYMYLQGVGVYLGCDLHKWTSLASTPIWLTVFGPKWSKGGSAAPQSALKAFAAANPRRVFTARDGFPTIALFLPSGVEHDRVLESLIGQLTEIGRALAPLTENVPPAEASSPVLPDEAPLAEPGLPGTSA